MAIKSNYFPTTISADFDVSVDVEIGIEEVQDWLDKASSTEIASLSFDHQDEDEGDLPHGAIIIHCGEDAGSLYDLQRIQEICNGLHISDILARLAA